MDARNTTLTRRYVDVALLASVCVTPLLFIHMRSTPLDFHK